MEQELQALCDQRASFNVVERKAEKGDYVKCSYEGKVGEELAADLVPENQCMENKAILGKKQAGPRSGVDAVAQGVIGLGKDENNVETKFDDDFEITPLAGKTVNDSIEVHEVRQKKHQTHSEEDFLKSMKVENIGFPLKEKIREDLKVRKEQENQTPKDSRLHKRFWKSLNSLCHNRQSRMNLKIYSKVTSKEHCKAVQKRMKSKRKGTKFGNSLKFRPKRG